MSKLIKKIISILASVMVAYSASAACYYDLDKYDAYMERNGHDLMCAQEVIIAHNKAGKLSSEQKEDIWNALQEADDIEDPLTRVEFESQLLGIHPREEITYVDDFGKDQAYVVEEQSFYDDEEYLKVIQTCNTSVELQVAIEKLKSIAKGLLDYCSKEPITNDEL